MSARSIYKCKRMSEFNTTKNRIKNALKSQGTYSKDMDLIIDLCAKSCVVMNKAYKDIEVLDASYCTEFTREMNQKLTPHPSFKIFIDSSEKVKNCLKELGLTVATAITSDNDELETLTEKIKEIDND